MSEKKELIKKKCLALAKAIIKNGMTGTDQDLVRALVDKAFACADQQWEARTAYEFYLKLKVDGDLAWSLSGMKDLVNS